MIFAGSGRELLLLLRGDCEYLFGIVRRSRASKSLSKFVEKSESIKRSDAQEIDVTALYYEKRLQGFLATKLKFRTAFAKELRRGTIEKHSFLLACSQAWLPDCLIRRLVHDIDFAPLSTKNSTSTPLTRMLDLMRVDERTLLMRKDGVCTKFI